jgi:hypothetical protein
MHTELSVLARGEKSLYLLGGDILIKVVCLSKDMSMLTLLSACVGRCQYFPVIEVAHTEASFQHL